jgi:hypothetical protein
MADCRQVHGPLDPQIPEVFERRFAQHALHSARQRTPPGGELRGSLIRFGIIRIKNGNPANTS